MRRVNSYHYFFYWLAAGRTARTELMRNLLILVGLSIAVAAGGVELRATLKASGAGAATAADWSGEDALFGAAD